MRRYCSLLDKQEKVRLDLGGTYSYARLVNERRTIGIGERSKEYP